MNALKIGVIGLGRIGKIHLKNLATQIPGAEVVAVADPFEEFHPYAQEFNIKEIYKDSTKVISHPDVEAIIICSPTDTHFNFIEQAARLGKHVFCEKPLEMTVEKIEQIKQIVDAHNIKLQVGFNRRFDVHFKKVFKHVANGNIGVPHIIKITSRDPGPPPIKYIKSSGGMFMDMSIHDFDMCRYLLNSEVTEVFAMGQVLVDPEIGDAGDVDTAVITLKFANGSLGVIDNSRKAIYGYDQRIEVFGTKGMSLTQNIQEENVVFFNEEGEHKGPLLDFFLERYQRAYYNEMVAFVDAILKEAPIPVTIEDALQATKIAFAANESLVQKTSIKVQ